MVALRYLFLFLIIVVAVFWLAGQMGLLRGKAPGDLGVHNNRLKTPSVTPNSVSSQAHFYPEHPQAKYASVQAFPVLNENAEQSLLRLGGLLNAMPGIKVIKQEKHYLHAECESQKLRFVDDLEMFFDAPNNLIHIRSASRLGRSDLGVNRKRVEELRVAYLSTLPTDPK